MKRQRMKQMLQMLVLGEGDEKQVINDVKMCKPADVDGNLSNAKIWIWFAQAVAVWLS